MDSFVHKNRGFNSTSKLSQNLVAISCSIFSFLLFFGSCQSNISIEFAEKAISEVKAKYAPDKRVALFQIEALPAESAIVLKGETNLPNAKATLLKKVSNQEVSVVDSIEILPAKSLGDKYFGIVRLSVCNIRSQPKHSAELATQATLGTPLRVYKKENGWFLVQTPDNYIAWLDAGGFEQMTKAAFDDWMAKDKVVYLKEFGFSFSEPYAESEKVSDLLAGNILQFAGTEGSFAKVRYPDNRLAYIPAAEVMNYDLWLSSRKPTPDHILATARQFMGRPYLWGGTSGKGVDCSGFTKTVFFLNGILLSRDASQQVHQGVEIPTDTTLKNLEPGDLLFFGRKASADKKEKITHVALYLGDGKVIHATGTVKIESLRRGDADFNEYRLNTFVRARRMLSGPSKNGVQFLRESEFYKIPGKS